MSEIATIATLEITPIHEKEGWLLKVVVEDEVGPRIPGEGDDEEQEIDLDTYYNEFIQPGQGSANVVAEVEDPAASERVSRLLDAIERGRHR